MAPANSRSGRAAPRGPQRQRGAVAIFAAIALITLLSAVGLAIDVGRLYYADRDLQRLADLAAIDGARIQSQCLGSAGIDEVTAEVDASLLRNRLPALVTRVTLLGLRQSGSDGLQSFLPAGSGQPADSVQVTLSQASPARILPLFAGDQSRTLTVRAAAQSQWKASAEVEPVVSASASGNFIPQFYGGALRASLGSGAGGFLGGVSTTVEVGALVVDSRDTTEQLPPINVPTPVTGLLSDLEAALNSTGDATAAQLVSAYADAVAAGRPGATVIPAEVLGLPLQGSYDGATASVGGVLSAIAGVLSRGEVIALPNLCGLLPLDQLPTAQLLPALCDSSVEITIPQPSRPGSFNSLTQLDVNNNSEDSAGTAGGLLRVRIKLLNPLNGQRIEVPLVATASPALAKVTALSCVRLGQPKNVADVEAKGPVVTFAIGDSNTFTTGFTSPDVDLGSALNDLAPAEILTASVRDVLTSAGLGGSLGGLLGNPLSAAFLGQPVTVSVRVEPVAIGDGRSENFCMQGPPYNVATQCNGAPATIGGVTAEDAVSRLADALGSVQLSVQLPQGLPLALDTALQAAVNELTATLSLQLKDALSLIAPQLVPILQSANLSVGESAVYLRSASGEQPRIYAQ